MSASTEKKNRRAAREAGTDKKTLAAEAEAKKQAKVKRKWTLGTIAVIVLIALILFLNSSFLYAHTTALNIGGESYTPAEVSYYYANQYHTFANQYGSYAGLFGLDTSAGLSGLDSQDCPMMEDGTWRDYFLQAATQDLIQVKALCDYAAENGITLTEEEIAQVDEGFDGIEEYAKALGYSSADSFFALNYGTGVNQAVIRQANLDSALASKVYSLISDSKEYSSEELEDYYTSLNGASDMFDFAYYYIAAETVETTDEAGETTTAATDETIAAAKATAEAIMAAYEDGFNEPLEASEVPEDSEDAGEDYVERLNAAVASQVADASATHPSLTAGSSLGVYKEWLMDSRSAGDITVVSNDDGTGFYVVVFLDRNDNHYHLAQVRHILVKAEADEDGNYTDEAKAAAKARAEEILAEWEAGDKTEESFAALAEQYSEDTGSNTNGGLYDAVAQGQMVDEFDQFCFEGHESGDTAIVYGESSSYAGYHVMYYVGEGELYSDYIAKTAMLNNDMSNWITELVSGYEAKTGFGLRLVG